MALVVRITQGAPRVTIRGKALLPVLDPIQELVDEATDQATAAAASATAAAASETAAELAETNAETAETNAEAAQIAAEAAASALTTALASDYLVKTANASLTAERVVTDTVSVIWDWATAGQAKANLGITGLTAVLLAKGDYVSIADTSDSNAVKKVLASDFFPRGHISGLTISNAVGDPTNDITIAAGEARDDADTTGMVLAAAITKRLDAAWAVGDGNGGLDTGSIANDTYHVHLIKRSDTGVVDALFSVSPTSPTMPANYTYSRRIGSFMRAGGAIVLFLQDGENFWLNTPVQDVSASNPGTSAVSRTLSIPTDIKLVARIFAGAYNGSSNFFGLITSLDLADIAPSTSVYNFGTTSTGGSAFSGASLFVRTNTSAQVRSRISASGASDVLSISTLGWLDRRGRES